MSRTKLIKSLRYCKEREQCEIDSSSECPYWHHWTDGEDCVGMLAADAADALEAADKRIEQLEKQEPTEKQVVDYCHKRCLVIVEEELFQRMKSTFAHMPKEGEWIESEDLESAMKGEVVCSICGEPQFALELANECIRMKNQKTKYCPNCGARMKVEGEK